MTPADEMGFDNQLEEQLRAVVKEVSLQPRLVEDFHGSEDVQTLLSRHLDHEASERRAIYFRLLAIESTIKRRRDRDNGSGSWLVTGDQADDHRLDAAAWLDKAPGERSPPLALRLAFATA